MNQPASTSAPTPAPISHFDTGARDWDQRPVSQQLAVVPPRLLQAVPFGARDHVLDFGGGGGLLATALAPVVGQVTALDTSANMLQVLDEKGFANIQTLLGDVFGGLPERYDAVVSCMAMHHVQDTAALLRAFADALKPGGRIALIDLYAEDGSFHGDNEAKGVKHFGFAPEALRELAEQAGLGQIAFAEIAQIDRDNGRGYPLFLMTGHKG